ncbi:MULTISPECIES: ABC transporter permease [Saccharomonospora]|jgi:NitT/TauT family transport system permease protein|uniref:ABC-type nitrate/sulfonate/bicarbonate transport system, permease component n=2 Tax=Saccharomonospora viridis TaxID=1852 RepID=C7MTV3_SACVD|nr:MULTISPECIES: ABC transporter permease [Saccharomonospora]ACU96836.1 ABC-type nitrate/sulfonate/bicarbonate transport system, permease component [Saccharomonospora viridis DSM 43017]KHF43017.1 ABC transporter permease [Saccharomonospora viridis]SFO86362.1 NitT/TauT family transport system permease protein [Saccharomonospora viridis]
MSAPTVPEKKIEIGRRSPGSTGGVPARVSVARRVGWALSGVLVRSIAILVLLAGWEFAPAVGLVDSTFLPPFSEVVVELGELIGNGQLLQHVQASLTRSLSGFGIAVAIAVPLGIVIGWYKVISDVLTPLVQLFLNTAALALLPVFVLLLGIGETSKIAIVVYACTWPILLNTITAVRNVDPILLKLGRSLNLPPLTLFGKVVLPASIPTIFTGLRLAGAAAIVVVIAAEMVGAKAGLGFLINDAQYNFAVPSMYAGIVTIAVVGVGFNQLLVGVERRLTRWQ